MDSRSISLHRFNLRLVGSPIMFFLFFCPLLIQHSLIEPTEYGLRLVKAQQPSAPKQIVLNSNLKQRMAFVNWRNGINPRPSTRKVFHCFENRSKSGSFLELWSSRAQQPPYQFNGPGCWQFELVLARSWSLVSSDIILGEGEAQFLIVKTSEDYDSTILDSSHGSYFENPCQVKVR